MLYKDACNSKSNQQNLGTIKCSNLCTEIVEFTSPGEIAVCNLASLVLPKFVRGVDTNSNAEVVASATGEDAAAAAQDKDCDWYQGFAVPPMKDALETSEEETTPSGVMGCSL